MKYISVVIPTYNRGHLVCEAIKSVMNQDVEDCVLEIIVVDDGSVDDTRQIISQFSAKVKYIYQENQGVGAARNRGIQEATGEWLAFLDSDDLWSPDRLSLQFKVLNSFPEYKVIHSNFHTVEGGRIIIQRGLEYWVAAISGVDPDQVDWSKIYSNKYNSNEYGITRFGLSFNIYSGNIFKALLSTVCANCWTSLIHKDCFEDEIRFAHLPIVEDYWFYCRLSEKNNVLFIDCPLVENRSHSGPRESKGSKEALLKGCYAIYENIYLHSDSPFRPSDEAIISRIKNINLNLLKYYLKNGNLAEAKALIHNESNSFGFENNWKLPFCKTLAALPFNILSHLDPLRRG